jgi:hypothetical protein
MDYWRRAATVYLLERVRNERDREIMKTDGNIVDGI